MMKTSIILACFLGCLLTGCWPEPCVPEATRCDGSFVDVCGVGNTWEPAVDCSGVSGGGEPWLCCPVPADEFGPAGHACVEASECLAEEAH
jgi:hypothetical protein